MKRVKQRNSTDCAIASVATILNISYEQANALVKFPVNGICMFHVAQLLCQNGYKCWITTPNRLERYKNNDALISYGYVNADYGHCVVWSCKEKKILDPSRQLQQKTYERLFARQPGVCIVMKGCT